MAPGISRYPDPLADVPILVRDSAGSFAGAAATGIYLAYPGGLILNTTAASAIAIFRLDPAHYPDKPAYKKQLIIRAAIDTNDVAPGNITLTGKLWACDGSSGASGTGPKATVGSLAATGAATTGITNPGADQILNDASAFFDFPAAGAYILGLHLTNGPAAANSNFQGLIRLNFAYKRR